MYSTINWYCLYALFCTGWGRKHQLHNIQSSILVSQISSNTHFNIHICHLAMPISCSFKLSFRKGRLDHGHDLYTGSAGYRCPRVVTATSYTKSLKGKLAHSWIWKWRENLEDSELSLFKVLWYIYFRWSCMQCTLFADLYFT